MANCSPVIHAKTPTSKPVMALICVLTNRYFLNLAAVAVLPHGSSAAGFAGHRVWSGLSIAIMKSVSASGGITALACPAAAASRITAIISTEVLMCREPPVLWDLQNYFPRLRAKQIAYRRSFL